MTADPIFDLAIPLDQVGTERTKLLAPQQSDFEEEASPFPDEAWRGIFAEYREAMRGSTEASDVAHFAALWAVIAVSLGRRVHSFAGDRVYPNVYLSFYGPSGDKKTTAMRRPFQHGLLSGQPGLQIVRNVGSAEGLADGLQQHGGQECSCLFYWEELSALLARGRWSGATIFEFLTEAYDCPSEWGLRYRTKNAIQIANPTPTIISGTTPEWFWKSTRPEDFYGGFANRFLFLAGARKSPLPNPVEPDASVMAEVKRKLALLPMIPECRAVWSPAAKNLWEEFYKDWEGRERTGLLAVALKRVHVYVRKLAMAYAACEGTLPQITLPQLQAAIAVTVYGATCVERLIDLQKQNSYADRELEQRFVKWIERHEGVKVRNMQQTMSKYCGTCDVFNRVLRSLAAADVVEIRDKKVYLGR